MKFKIRLSAEIFDFPNLYEESVEIEKFLHEYIKNCAAIHELPEWEFDILILLIKGKDIGVFKKGATFPSSLMKSQTIFIPIPTDKMITWGISEKKFLARPSFDDRVNFYSINPQDFKSLKQYIIECSKIGIINLLKSGINLKGVKIRIE